MSSYASLTSYNSTYAYVPGHMLVSPTTLPFPNNQDDDLPEKHPIKENSVIIHTPSTPKITRPPSIPPILIDAPMEGFFLDPPIKTAMSGTLVLWVRPEGLFFRVRSRKASSTILSIGLYFLSSNNNDSVDDSTLLTMLYSASTTDAPSHSTRNVVTQGFVDMKELASMFTYTQFIQAMNDENIMVLVTTTQYPEGEIAGLVVPLQL